MRVLVSAIVVLACASVSMAVIVTPTQTGGWRGWNNATSTGWLDSWSNHDDWGTGTFCDANVAEFSRADIQAAIAGVGGGVYDAWLTVRVQGATGTTSYGTTPEQVTQALTTGHPVGGVFDIPQVPGALFSEILGTGGGYNFEVDTTASANSMFTDLNTWSATPEFDDGDPLNSYLLTINIGQPIVDFYLGNADADGFFISWIDALVGVPVELGQGTMNAGDRLELVNNDTTRLVIIPEPATLGLLLMGGVAALTRRRR